MKKEFEIKLKRSKKAWTRLPDGNYIFNPYGEMDQADLMRQIKSHFSVLEKSEFINKKEIIKLKQIFEKWEKYYEQKMKDFIIIQRNRENFNIKDFYIVKNLHENFLKELYYIN